MFFVFVLVRTESDTERKSRTEEGKCQSQKGTMWFPNLRIKIKSYLDKSHLRVGCYQRNGKYKKKHELPLITVSFVYSNSVSFLIIIYR